MTFSLQLVAPPFAQHWDAPAMVFANVRAAVQHSECCQRTKNSRTDATTQCSGRPDLRLTLWVVEGSQLILTLWVLGRSQLLLTHCQSCQLNNFANHGLPMEALVEACRAPDQH